MMWNGYVNTVFQGVDQGFAAAGEKLVRVLGSTLRRRRIAPLSRARRSISAFGDKLVNVSRIPMDLTRATAVPLIG